MADSHATSPPIIESIPPDVIAKYRRRFNAIDLNKDGVITLREMAAVAKVFGYILTIDELALIFGKRDLDDSGGISFDEFVIAMVDRSTRAQQIAPIRKKFWEWDTRSRGYITSDEAFPILHRDLGFDMNKTESFLDMFDKNRDYRLSLQEFKAFHEKYEQLCASVVRAFQTYDVNRDGFIDYEEARSHMSAKGLSDQEIINIFMKYDVDGDGKLNQSEFAAFWDVPIF